MMKKISRYSPLFLGMFFCCVMSDSEAERGGTNPITVTFEDGRTSFSAGAGGTANYLVRVNSGVPNTGQPLVLYFLDQSSTKLASQITNVSSGCAGSTQTCGNPMSLYPGDTCCLMLELDAGGQLTTGTYVARAYVGTSPDVGRSVYSGLASDVTVSISDGPPPQTTTLTAPTPNRFTIAYINPTDTTATGTYTVSYSGAVPQNLTATNLGTALLPNCSNTSTLNITQNTVCTLSTATTGSCTITFATATNSDQVCLATGGITVSEGNTSNTLTTSVAFSIAGYYVFALSAPSSSVPQVVASSDSVPKAWDSSAQCASASCTVTGAQNINNGNYLDNLGDTYCIITGSCSGGTAIGGQLGTGGNAARQCYAITTDNTGAGLANGTWYLPAICQMGPVGSGYSAGCTNAANTKIDNLLQLGFISISGSYWSSTENSTNPQDDAWGEYFSSGGSNQYNYNKDIQLGVRCSRALSL